MIHYNENKDENEKYVSQRYTINRRTIMFIMFPDCLMVERIFVSTQVKRSVIISNKPAYDLPNNLRVRF